MAMDPGLYLYGDMVLPKEIPPSVCQKIGDFRFDGDVVIASYPKTGTTWLQEMAWLIMNNGDIPAASQTELSVRSPHLEHLNLITMKPILDTIDTEPKPRVIKTHFPARFFQKQLEVGHGKVIVMMRNPKDTLVSYYYFSKTISVFASYSATWDYFFETFVEKKLCFGDYFDFYASWLEHLGRTNVLFVKYEAMKRNLRNEITRVAQFLGKILSDDVVDQIVAHVDFDAMKANKMTNWELCPFVDQTISPFMRSGNIGGWKKYFTPEQNSMVNRKYEEVFGAKKVVLDFE